MLATLFLSRGTPMLLGGDEFGRTQYGNNNSYCQDSPISWLDWDQAQQPAGRQLSDYVAYLIALRRSSGSLQQQTFPVGSKIATDLHDIDWFSPEGVPMTSECWSDGATRAFGLRRASVAHYTGPGKNLARNPDYMLDYLQEDGTPDAVEIELLLFNGACDPVTFTLPQPALRWQVVLESVNLAQSVRILAADAIEVAAHGLTVLSAISPEFAQ